MNAVRVGIGVLLRQENKILLGQRKNSHGSETWAPPGGHLELEESILECASREVKEETDLIVKASKIIGFTEDIFNKEKHYITFFVEATEFEGTIKLCEPHKCYGWEWFSLDSLPNNLFLSLQNFFKKQPHHIHIPQQNEKTASL